MTREEYLAKRKELLTKAAEARDTGSLTEELVSEIKALDSTFEKESLEMVNARALEGEPAPVNFNDMSVKVPDGKVVETMAVESIKMNIDSKEYRDAWLTNLAGKQMTPEMQAAYATTDSHTAIPTLVADKFFEKMKKLAPMLNEITLMQVAGNLKFVAEGTRNDAAKHTENTDESAAADTIVSVTLGAFEFMKIIKISKAVVNMAIDQFEDWLVEMLSGDIARAIDKYIISDSTNGIVKNFTSTSTNQIIQTATAGYGYADLCDLVAKLPAAYDAEAKFLVHKSTLWGKIKKITDTNKMPVFDPTTKTLLGYPVIEDDYVSTSDGCLYLGAFKNVVGNLSEGIAVEKNDHAGFTSGSVVFRGYAAFDSKVANGEAIVRLVTTA